MAGIGFKPEYMPNAEVDYPISNSFPLPSFPGYPVLPDSPYNPPPFCQSEIPRAYYWVNATARGGIPSTALEAGVDSDGSKIFVGRAYHEGDWIPAKVIPEKNISYVAYGGAEHPKEDFEVLCEQRFDWVHSSGGHIPHGAVDGGRTSDGETLYIGRAYHDGSVTVGKVHPSHGVCYIPYGGEELSKSEYEILVLRA